MRKFLASSACVISIFMNSVPALAIEATELSVSRVGDTNMICGQLSQEAILMRDIVMTTQDIKENTELKERGITAVGTLGSFLIGTITGGVGIAAAGFLLKQSAGETSDEADGIQDIAMQRRSLMVGIYNAKGCNGPIEHVFQDQLNIQGQEALSAVQLASLEPQAGDTEKSARKKPHFNQ